MAIVLAVVSILNQRDTVVVDEISLPPVDDYQDNSIDLPQRPETNIDPRPAIVIELSDEEKEKGFLTKTASASFGINTSFSSFVKEAILIITPSDVFCLEK